MSGMPGASDQTTAKPSVKLTYDDFVQFPNDRQRHELIDGAHYVTPSPSTRHQQILGRLHLAIGNWLDAQPIGQLFCAPLDVVLSHFDVVEPDLLYVSNERAAEVLTTAHAAGAPDLVIEIGSPGTRRRDQTIKRRLYQRFGVTEYWFVDPASDAIRVYQRMGGRFDAVIELSSDHDDALTTRLFPGLQLSLKMLFRD
jgi:Uma2 family endonuclease